MSERRKERGPVIRHWRKMMQRSLADQVKTIYTQMSATPSPGNIPSSTCVHVALATHVHIAMTMVMIHVHRVHRVIHLHEE